MAKDPSVLMQDIVMSLYSTLDIESSLHRAVNLLKEYIPLDLIHVFTVDFTTNTHWYLAEATKRKGDLIDEKIQVSADDLAHMRINNPGEISFLNSAQVPVLRVIRKHFISKLEPPVYEIGKDFSVMQLSFDIDADLIGALSFVVKGRDVFKEHHKKIIELIRRPLIGVVLNLLHHRKVVRQNERLVSEKQQLEHSLGHVPAGQMIGAATGLKQVVYMINQVAALESPVLVFGETGTGKEVVANAICRASGRKHRMMVRVNCGAIPESLMDSELFGHEKGAFTGAEKLKRGYFEQADNGTIFLDEIGELPLAAQTKLLRVLQTMEFHRVGASVPISVNVRVIAATNRDLSKMVKEGSFREDLWFRLNVFPIFIPPLRDRKEDLFALAKYFVERKATEMNLEYQPKISNQAVRQLSDYDWPGNIRELQNVIERSLILSRDKNLTFDWITEIHPDKGLRQKTPLSADTFPSMDEMIARHIEAALELSRYRIEGKGGAAQLLSMNPSTLRSRMKKLGITIKKRV